MSARLPAVEDVAAPDIEIVSGEEGEYTVVFRLPDTKGGRVELTERLALAEDDDRVEAYLLQRWLNHARSVQAKVVQTTHLGLTVADAQKAAGEAGLRAQE